jgi:hypothetical protein
MFSIVFHYQSFTKQGSSLPLAEKDFHNDWFGVVGGSLTAQTHLRIFFPLVLWRKNMMIFLKDDNHVLQTGRMKK